MAVDLRGAMTSDDADPGRKSSAAFRASVVNLSFFASPGGGIPVPLAVSPFNPGIQT